MALTIDANNKTKRVALFLLLVSMCMTMLSTAAFSKENTRGGAPFFIEGYDVVSYFQDTGPLLGTIAFSTKYQNKQLLFSNQTNLQSFLADPEKYMPAYNGYCAYGMVYGMTSIVDPLIYDVVDGRLYLQLDRGTKKRWNRRVGRYIKKGNKAWINLQRSITN